MRRMGAAMLMILGLAACARDEAPNMVMTGPVEAPHDLLALGTAGRVIIAPPAGLSHDLGDAVADRLAEKMSADAVPAVTLAKATPADTSVPDGYHVTAVASPDGSLQWTVTGPGQQPVFHTASPGPVVDAASATAAADAIRPALQQAIEADIDRPLSDRMAAAPVALTANEKAIAAAKSARTAAVAVGDIEGLPRQQALILKASLEAELKRQGHTIEAAAPYLVSGRIELGNADASGTVRLTVHWSVRAAGSTTSLGSIDQSNGVPAAILNGSFPDLAVAIAGGAVEGINNALMQGAARAALGK